MSSLIIGESNPIRELKSLIQRVANSKSNILIIGESGTGKELVARMIHETCSFKDQPFVPVNCGAIPENLIETELFGHQKGSFTGAVSDKLGLFEVANRGTLFLDEVGELPLSMQVKLLRALQERKIRRVGGVDDISIDVRIIAATNRDLEAAVRTGEFREDLYYRLNVILIKTPPLRDRPGDIRILAEKFLKSFIQRSGKKIDSFSREAMTCLESYHWPGNVRELENVVERAVTLESSERIESSSLPTGIQGTASPREPHQRPQPTAPSLKAGVVNLDQILADIEKAYIVAATDQSGGLNRAAADALGITFRSLRYRAQKLGLG